MIHQCLGRVSHCHMSVRAWAALIASVRHLSPTRRGEEGDGPAAGGGWRGSWSVEVGEGQQAASM